MKKIREFFSEWCMFPVAILAILALASGVFDHNHSKEKNNGK